MPVYKMTESRKKNQCGNDTRSYSHKDQDENTSI